MKKLMFVVASLVLGSSAMAADGTETKFSGELRARYLMAENPSMAPDATADGSSGWMQRSKLGVTFSKGEDLMGQITLMANANWGDNAGTAGGAQNGAVTPDSGGDAWIYEAWGFWKAMDNFSLRLGRGSFQVADGSVIGTNDWEAMPKVFEGVLGTWYSEFANIHAFGVKGFDATAAVGTDTPEANFYGLSVDVKNLPDALKLANVHFLQINTHDLPAGTQTGTLRYGLTVGGGMMNIDYRATYAGYSGESSTGAAKTDLSGSMMDLEAGYTFEDIMKWRIGALYHADSGEEAAGGETTRYNPFHYNSHENAGLMDIVGWGNSTYIKVGTSIQPWEGSMIGLDYYMFSMTEETDAGGPALTAGYGGAVNATASDDVGSEIDLYAHKTYANGFTAGLRYGIFTPGDYFANTAEAASQIMLEGKFAF